MNIYYKMHCSLNSYSPTMAKASLAVKGKPKSGALLSENLSGMSPESSILSISLASFRAISNRSATIALTID